MKQYTHKDQTPLAFHKFFWFFSTPVGFCILLFNMVSEISEIVLFNWLYLFHFAYYFAALTFMIMYFIGFFKWKSYAWYGVITFLCVGVAYRFFSVIIYAIYVPDQLATIVGEILGYLIYAILVGIYYYKRRPLFFANAVQYNAPDIPDSANIIEAGSPNCEEMPSAKYCRQCGYKLLDGSQFCSKCGTPVVKK